tara:strand:+ start:1450 stop:1737 length:288 start_codon:yes stop_codon:yes gene_type:complete
MTNFEIASSINTLMMMAGTDINDEQITTSKFMSANDVDIALDFAVDTIMSLLPSNDREAVWRLLGEEGRASVDGYLEVTSNLQPLAVPSINVYPK